MGSRSTSPTGFLLKATSRVNYLYRILLTDATARASLERRLMQSWAASSRRAARQTGDCRECEAFVWALQVQIRTLSIAAARIAKRAQLNAATLPITMRGRRDGLPRADERQ